jgi:protein-disulfide isomerase
MIRRFLVTSFKRTFFLFLMVCLGCSAQLAPADLTQRIERQLRASYTVSPTVKVTVSAPRPSEFANYDTVTVTFDGDGKKETYDFLLSKDQKTLVRMTKMDLTKDPFAQVMKKIDVTGRPVRGNAKAKVVVVNYDDLQCPYCSVVHQTLFPQLLKEYGDRVAFIYKDFPLSEIHPWATHAAVDANCLAAQNGDAYWDFADSTHANRQEINAEKGLDNQFALLDRNALAESGKFHLDATKLQSCVKEQKNDAVNASVKEGEALKVDGTPTIFVNGQMVDGVRPVEEFRALFDNALRQAGVSAPVHAAPAASAAPQPPGSASPPAAAPR